MLRDVHTGSCWQKWLVQMFTRGLVHIGILFTKVTYSDVHTGSCSQDGYEQMPTTYNIYISLDNLYISIFDRFEFWFNIILQHNLLVELWAIVVRFYQFRQTNPNSHLDIAHECIWINMERTITFLCIFIIYLSIHVYA